MSKLLAANGVNEKDTDDVLRVCRMYIENTEQHAKPYMVGYREDSFWPLKPWLKLANVRRSQGWKGGCFFLDDDVCIYIGGFGDLGIHGYIIYIFR